MRPSSFSPPGLEAEQGFLLLFSILSAPSTATRVRHYPPFFFPFFCVLSRDDRMGADSLSQNFSMPITSYRGFVEGCAVVFSSFLSFLLSFYRRGKDRKTEIEALSSSSFSAGEREEMLQVRFIPFDSPVSCLFPLLPRLSVRC